MKFKDPDREGELLPLHPDAGNLRRGWGIRRWLWYLFWGLFILVVIASALKRPPD